MSSQTLVEQSIGFGELCPKWAKSIQTGVLEEGLDYGYSTCIVGEAHGFSNAYVFDQSDTVKCDKCVGFACRLVSSNNGAAAIGVNSIPYELPHISYINHGLLNVLLKDFIKHWNDKHV